MPPKRKRADQPAAAATATTRSTRSSTRNAATSSNDSVTSTAAPSPAKVRKEKKATVITEEAPATNDHHPADDEPPPPPKKVARRKDAGAAKESVQVSKTKDKSLSSAKSKSGRSSTTKPAAPKKSEKDNLADELNPQSYTPQRFDALFDKYADEPPTADTISPEGLEQLCIDAEMPMEGALPLLLAWSVNAATMGSITKSEWATLSDLRIDTAPKLGIAMKDLEKLFFPSDASDSAKTSPSNTAIDPYKKDQLEGFERDPEGAFQKFYSYCFGLARTEQQRNIDVQTAMALWNVLILQKYPIMPDFIAFLEQNSSLKGVTKDLWNMVPEFCKSVDKDLNGYDECEAWPSLIDDFVRWKQEQQTSTAS